MLVLVLNFLIAVSSANGANILGFFFMPSISHQLVFQPIWRELSLRGHQVTVITPDPLNDPDLVNLTEISVRDSYELMKEWNFQGVMSSDASYYSTMTYLYNLLDVIVEKELNNSQVLELLSNRNQTFDLILIECLHPTLWGLAARFQAPTICITSLQLPLHAHDAVGNPDHPLLYPDMFLNLEGNTNLPLQQKLEIICVNLLYRYHYYNTVVPRADQMARKYFGDDIPFIADLERNVSMIFMNVNSLFYNPRPLVPAMVLVGQMQIKPTKQLPLDLKEILDNAPEGAIYFSLGSNVHSVNLPEDLRIIIMSALSELPYKVLWKWESDHLRDQPDNIIIRKWLPQQDVLSHPNVKVFVTQGGLQSTEEAISRAVPMVGIPFIADQPMNVRKIVETGIGLGLKPSSLTKDELKWMIMEVSENPKYKAKIIEMRDLLYDQPMTGLERAVWWSEYVIRHRGAKHLRSLTADLDWYEYFLVDIVILLLILVVTIILILYKIILVL